jgi:hypothetical protein
MKISKSSFFFEDLEALLGLVNAPAVITLPESSGKQSIYHNRCAYGGDGGIPALAFLAIDYYLRESSISAKRTLFCPLHPMQKAVEMKPVQAGQLRIWIIVQANGAFVLLA